MNEFDCVIKESPTLTLAHVRKTLLLVTMGDLDAALESAKRAHDTDPLLPLTAAAEVNVRLWRREFDAAAKIGAQAVQLQPYFMLCRAYYGVALEFSGRLEPALEQYQIGGVVTQGLPWMRALEGACLVKLGRRSEARAVLNELLARRHTGTSTLTPSHDCAMPSAMWTRRLSNWDAQSMKMSEALRDPLRPVARRVPF